MSQTVFRAPREWTRVHPVSPLLGAWPVFAVIGGLWFYTSGPEWVSSGDDVPDLDEDLGFTIHPLIFVGAAILLAAIAVGFSYLFWYFTQYRIGDDAVYQRSGVLSRQHKQARLNRLQAVDVVQPLLGRIFGFSKLRIEVAGGEGSATEIAFLRAGDADALRNEILVLAAGHSAPVAADAQIIAQAADAVGASPDQV
ncbi:MAG: PH domain-containing protein, partial [Demequina sp.]